MNPALLHLLADGKFHSGNELAKHLGVSRTTVWKQVQYLESRGLPLHSIRGRGYRVPGGISLIDESRLREHLEAVEKALGIIHIQVDLETDSTNLNAQRALLAGVRRALFVAECQTGGRGRRGRPWVSPLAANLYFSLSWPFEDGVAGLEGLSLVVGLAIRNALASLGVQSVELKWPNDVLLNQRKLAGVLIEIGGDLSGDCTAVIGIGLNVLMPSSADSLVNQPWADLRAHLGEQIDRTQLLAVILERLLHYLALFKESGFSGFVAEWQLANAFQDCDVYIIQGDRLVEGVCLGVDGSGALRLETAQGVKLFQGGEISLRGA